MPVIFSNRPRSLSVSKDVSFRLRGERTGTYDAFVDFSITGELVAVRAAKLPLGRFKRLVDVVLIALLIVHVAGALGLIVVW